MSDSHRLGWHVISGEDLLRLLRRVGDGESPDLVYAEGYANARHEHIAPWSASMREAVEALVDVIAYLHPNPNSPHAEKWAKWREAALDKAAQALDSEDDGGRERRDA